MSLYDKMLCSGPTGCGHPRHNHSGTHVKGSKTACTKHLGNEESRQLKCSCRQFKEVRTNSSDSKPAEGGAKSGSNIGRQGVRPVSADEAGADSSRSSPL